MEHSLQTVAQIIAKLRRADGEIGQGKKIAGMCRLLEITEQTCDRWLQRYGRLT